MLWELTSLLFFFQTKNWIILAFVISAPPPHKKPIFVFSKQLFALIWIGYVSIYIVGFKTFPSAYFQQNTPHL